MSSLKQYEYVIAIATQGGISQASESLGMAQPTLSKYLKKLESDLGIELFDRSTLPIRLTRAGELYVETGRKMLDFHRQFEKQLEEIKENKNTVIRVGLSPSRSPYMMPSVVEAYKQRNPTGRVIIEERTTTELNSRLASGELDLIINLLDEDTDGFASVHLFNESVLVAVAAHQCHTDSAIELLQTSPLISVGRGQAMWQTMQRIVREVGGRPPEIECQSIESAMALVKHGLGAMLVPSYIAEFGTAEQNRNILFLPLPTEWAKAYQRDVCLFYRKEQFLTQAEREFIACVEHIKQKHYGG